MSTNSFLPENSPITKLIQDTDWLKSPMGPVESWSESLKLTVSLIIGSRFPMFIWWGRDFINIYNEAYAEIAGPSKHPEFFGKPAKSMWAEIWDTVGIFANQVVTTGESLSFKDLPLSVYRKGKNNEAFFTFTYSPIIGTNGKIEGLLGVVQETTEQVLSIREVEFQRKKLSDLFMNSPIAFARVKGPDHVFDLINHAYLELLGHREVLGKSVREALPEIEGQGFFELLDEVYRSGKRYVANEAKVILIRNGVPETRYASFIYEPDKNLSGEVVGIIAIAHDITDIVLSRQAEEENARAMCEALKERDTSLRNLGVINRVGEQLTSILDMKVLVQQITDAGVELSGAQFGAFFYNVLGEDGKQLLLYTISGARQEAFSKFPNPRATEIFHPTFIGAGTVRSDDITRDPRYGQNSPYKGIPPGHLPVRSYLAVSVISRTGEVIGGLFFGHEEPGVFTEQIVPIIEGLASQTAIAMDNARLYQNLEQSLHARDEFLSIASHELKTPLTSLILQSQLRNKMLARGDSYLTNDKLKKMLESDERQLRRLNRLIDDMLDISRIQTGKLSLDKSEHDLGAIAQDVVERFDQQFTDAGVSCDFHRSGSPIVHVDPYRIEQVIINLLTNSLKYGNKKPVSLSVEVNGEEAILKVSDQGRGIKEEDQSRVFSRFERAVSHSEVSGLGLGLSISKEIIEAHEGKISLKSKVGEGSVFEIRLPLIPKA